jgi:hypothetical protein
MPATIVKPTGDVRRIVSANVNVAIDGLVTVTANYFLPDELMLRELAIDAPITDKFKGLPSLQRGALFVLNRTVNKRGGLLFCDVELVGAMNPPRYVVFDGKEARSFTSAAPESTLAALGTVIAQRPYRTDYFAPYRSITWTKIINETVRPQNANPVEEIERFNSRLGFVRYLDGNVIRIINVLEKSQTAFITELSQQEIGRVVRSTLTTTQILEPID